MDFRVAPSNCAPSSGDGCVHRQDCGCRRPAIGRSLVVSVALQLLMGVVVIITGSTLVGFVALGSMAACMWMYALAEVLAFYRVGLPDPEPIEIGKTRSNNFNPHQF